MPRSARRRSAGTLEVIAKDVNMPDRIRTKCYVAGISVWMDYGNMNYRVVKQSKGIVANIRTDTELSASEWEIILEQVLESWRAKALRMGLL